MRLKKQVKDDDQFAYEQPPAGVDGADFSREVTSSRVSDRQ